MQSAYSTSNTHHKSKHAGLLLLFSVHCISFEIGPELYKPNAYILLKPLNSYYKKNMAIIALKDVENISDVNGKVHRNDMKLTDQIKNKEV